MARLPQIITELCTIERIEVKDYKYLEENKRHSIEVIAKDGREYLVFNNNKTATDYAIKLYVKYEDDPTVIKQLGWLEKSLEQYASERVNEEGVKSMLSYDQHHQVKLAGTAMAYRSI